MYHIHLTAIRTSCPSVLDLDEFKVYSGLAISSSTLQADLACTLPWLGGIGRFAVSVYIWAALWKSGLAIGWHSIKVHADDGDLAPITSLSFECPHFSPYVQGYQNVSELGRMGTLAEESEKYLVVDSLSPFLTIVGHTNRNRYKK